MEPQSEFLSRYADRHLAVHMRALPEARRREVLARIRPQRLTGPESDAPAPPQAGPHGYARFKVWAGIALAAVLGSLLWIGWAWLGRPDLPHHLPLGVPAAPLVLHREAYSLGFDPEKKMPRWVGYLVVPGSGSAKSGFRSDPAIAFGAQLAEDAFKGSSFNRAALVAPRHVAGLTPEALLETRYRSVFVPQSDGVFHSVFKVLDNEALALAETGHQVWITKGPVFPQQESAREELIIPQAYFHIALWQQGRQWQTRAYLVPNGESVSSQRRDEYRVTIDNIEDLTGLDLFAELRDREERVLEQSL